MKDNEYKCAMCGGIFEKEWTDEEAMASAEDKNKIMKNILFTILGTIVFFGGAYLMGNYVLDTFNGDTVEQIMSSLYGILLWVGIGVIGLIIWGIYEGVCALANKT